MSRKTALAARHPTLPVRTAPGFLLLAAAAVLAARAAAGQGPTCQDLAIFSSPAEPRVGKPLRIVVAADAGSAADVLIVGPSVPGREQRREKKEGPPWSVVATIEQPESGTYRVVLRGDGASGECERILVADEGSLPPGGPGPAPAAQRAWDRKAEALYAAWIEHLFSGPPEDEMSFPSLEPVLRDPARNFLYDHVGLGEDGPGSRAFPATPDCADLPYVLRMYFAWKLGLPFGFRRCNGGSATTPPRCAGLVTTHPGPAAGNPLAAFLTSAHSLTDSVHSGNARTALGDDATDFYPIPLTRAAIRPGTIYADPYGHTLVVAGWVSQTSEGPGLLLAVDAQPDNTVARKRFWEGTFLFADVPSAGPGFKAFRPLVRDEAGGRLRSLTNAELDDDPRFTSWSIEQEELDPEAFYARMDALANPLGLEPEAAYESMLDALVEQLETRVGAVDNGERFVRAHPGVVVAMPEGGAIFQTSGPWEDYATPSRDFRLIIALNVLERLPPRIRQHPELFVLGERAPGVAAADVERLHAQRITERAIAYSRSDGTSTRLTVADVFARRAALEMGYNPNDCIEVRWGAPDDAPEQASCRRRAPAAQRTRMERYRVWLHESRRPVTAR
jgi:hypothetical protein